MACRASAVVVSRRLSGKASDQAAYFSLQGKQLGNRIVPAMQPGASVMRAAVSDCWCWLGSLAAGSISGLTFGITEGMFAFGLATSRHRCSPLHNEITVAATSRVRGMSRAGHVP